jgi:hypothetical protein
MISSHVRTYIDRLIAGDLTTNQHRKVRDHIRACSDCAQYYEEQRAVEDDLFASAGMAPSAIERMQELVLEDLKPAPKERWPAWSAIATFVVAAAALIIWVKQPSEFTARGGGNVPLGAGLWLYVVDPATRVVTHLEEGAHVGRDKVVSFGYSNEHYQHLTIVAVDADNTVSWLANDVAITHEAGQIPFSGAWTLSDSPTTVRIFAIFSDANIDPAVIEDALKPGARHLDLPSAYAQDFHEVHID